MYYTILYLFEIKTSVYLLVIYSYNIYINLKWFVTNEQNKMIIYNFKKSIYYGLKKGLKNKIKTTI